MGSPYQRSYFLIINKAFKTTTTNLAYFNRLLKLTLKENLQRSLSAIFSSNNTAISIQIFAAVKNIPTFEPNYLN